jgi:hypothetical protein
LRRTVIVGIPNQRGAESARSESQNARPSKIFSRQASRVFPDYGRRKKQRSSGALVHHRHFDLGWTEIVIIGEFRNGFAGIDSIRDY